MIWDFGIVYLALSLAIAGWHIGAINSWPAPIAILLATSCTQLLYVNAGAILLDQTRLPPDLAFLIAYAIIWILLEGFFEFGLMVMIPIKKRFEVSTPSRVGGACVGLIKAAVVLTFATAASFSSWSMPDPPPGPPIATWMADTSRESLVLRTGRRAVSHMPMELAQRVVSEDSPFFTPTFEELSTIKIDQYRARKWRELFDGLRTLDSEISKI